MNEEISYEPLSEENFEEFSKFLLKYFARDEPMNRKAGLTEENAGEHWRAIIKACSRHPVSFLARNSNREIVGIRLSTILRPENLQEHFELLPEKLSTNFQEFMEIYSFYEKGSKANLPKFTRLLKFFAICSRDDYRKYGIAKHLIKLSMEAGKREGCDLVEVDCTTFKSQNLFRSLGFMQIFELAYDTLKDAKTGEPRMVPYDGTKTFQVFAKQL